MSNDWIYWFVAGALLIYGLALQWWAVLANRAMDRRRCPRCWYDMTGTTERRCPECGRTYRSEVQLHRRRPRWRTLAIGIAMMFGAALAMKASRDGFAVMIPTPVLAFIAPYVVGNGGAVEEEFTRRFSEGDISEAAVRRIVRRWIDDDAPPWKIEILTRDQWPADMPMHISASFQQQKTGSPWLDQCAFGLTLVPEFGSAGVGELDWRMGEVIESERTESNGRELPRRDDDWQSRTLRVDDLPAGATEVTFTAIVDMVTPKPDEKGSRGGPVQVWSKKIRVPVAVTEGIGGAMTAFTAPGAGFEAYLGFRPVDAKHTRPGRRSGRARRAAGGDPILLDRECGKNVKLIEGVVIALKVAVLYEGSPVATGTAAWRDSVTLHRMTLPIELDWIVAPASFAQIPDEEIDRWSVRVTFDPEGALRFFDAGRYLEIPEPIVIPFAARRPPGTAAPRGPAPRSGARL